MIGLRDRAGGRLKLQRHAIGIAQHVHRLAFVEVHVLHGRVQLGDLVLLELAGRLPRAELGFVEDLVGRVAAEAVERVDEELPQRAGVALVEQLGRALRAKPSAPRRAAVGQADFDQKRIAAIDGRRPRGGDSRTRRAPPGAVP